MANGKRGAPMGNKNAAGRGGARKTVGRSAAAGAAIGAASAVGKIGTMTLAPAATLALGVPVVKTVGLSAMVAPGMAGAVVGAGAGLAGYGVYKGYKHFKNKK